MSINLPVPIIPPGLGILGYDKLSVTSGVANLPTPPNGAVFAYLLPESGNLRWRGDGVDPTGAIGYPMWDGNEYYLSVSVFTTLRLILMTGTSTCDLNIMWYGGSPL